MRATRHPVDVTASLARAWPDALADPGAAADYAAALADLDPAALEKAVAALAARGRPAPPPAILRTVVLSWQQAAATSVTVEPLPATTPVVPDVRARAPALVPMLASGVLLLSAAGLTRATWMTIAGDGRAVAIAGSDVRGGGIVGAAGLLALLVALIGASLAWRGGAPARVRGAFALLALASVTAVFGAMTGLMRVSEVGNRLVFDVDPAERGVTASADLAHVATVSAGSALWTTLVLALVSAALALHGLLARRRT